MSRAKAAHILIVHPPAVSPSAPPPQMARLALQAPVHGLPFEQCDANIEFYTRYLFNRGHPQKFIAEIEAKTTRGVYRTADSESQRLLDDLSENRSQWERRIAAAGQNLAACRADGFYHPGNCLRVLGEVEALLKLASLAFYPAKIRRDGFEHPRVGDPEGLAAFSRDADSNPFIGLCQTGLVLQADRPGMHLLLLWISAMSQLPAAVTLAVFSKQVNPALHVAMAGEPGLTAGCDRFVDSLLGTGDSELHPMLIRFAGGPAAECKASKPGSLRLPIGLYLSPATVLPVDARAVVNLPDTVGSLIQNRDDVRAENRPRSLLIMVDSVQCKHFPGLTADGKPADGLGIRMELKETCRDLDADSLRRVKASLIIWQNPEGSLEALKAVLWQSSRAGIWNHLQVPRDPGDPLAAALLRFARENPNIVHSWGAIRPGNLSTGNHSAKNRAAIYGRVAKLPGKPFWQKFPDSVHLLFYLAKHGREKVMRWRVTDTGEDIYTVGSRLDFHYEKPEQLPAGYLDEVCRMVADGGSVDMQRVRYNLERAFLIAYVLENGAIVGNSSLKNPRSEYIKTVKRQSGLNLAQYVERGYTSVRPEYRGMGIGARLLAGLTERAGGRKVFSVIGAENVAARKMAIRNRTRLVAEYVSPRTGKRVGIWIPEWMLD